MSDRSVIFGIVGLGNIGMRHAKHIVNNSRAKLMAVCDVDRIKLRRFTSGNEDGVDSYSGLSELLKQSAIEVVNICTPNYLHTPMTIAAIEAGKHVVCEKPMALSSFDCQRMIDAAKANNKKLFVVKQNRYNPPVNAVKQLIMADKLGKIYQLSINCFWNRNANYYTNSNWRGSKKYDGGCLFTQCSHFIDIMYYLCGPVKSISGLVKNQGHGKLIEFEDSGTFILKTASGALVNFNFSTCSYQQNMEGSVSILAEKGTIKIGGQYLNTIEYQCIKDTVIDNLPQGNTANDYGTYKGSMSNHDKVIQNVIDTLNGKDSVATNGQNGKAVVQIIEEMYKSVL